MMVYSSIKVLAFSIGLIKDSTFKLVVSSQSILVKFLSTLQTLSDFTTLLALQILKGVSTSIRTSAISTISCPTLPLSLSALSSISCCTFKLSCNVTLFLSSYRYSSKANRTLMVTSYLSNSTRQILTLPPNELGSNHFRQHYDQFISQFSYRFMSFYNSCLPEDSNMHILYLKAQLDFIVKTMDGDSKTRQEETIQKSLPVLASFVISICACQNRTVFKQRFSLSFMGSYLLFAYTGNPCTSLQNDRCDCAFSYLGISFWIRLQRRSANISLLCIFIEHPTISFPSGCTNHQNEAKCLSPDFNTNVTRFMQV